MPENLNVKVTKKISVEIYRQQIWINVYLSRLTGIPQKINGNEIGQIIMDGLVFYIDDTNYNKTDCCYVIFKRWYRFLWFNYVKSVQALVAYRVLGDPYHGIKFCMTPEKLNKITKWTKDAHDFEISQIVVGTF